MMFSNCEKHEIGIELVICSIIIQDAKKLDVILNIFDIQGAI